MATKFGSPKAICNTRQAQAVGVLLSTNMITAVVPTATYPRPTAVGLTSLDGVLAAGTAATPIIVPGIPALHVQSVTVLRETTT